MATLGGAAAAWPLAVRAQQGERVRRVGVLIGSGDQSIIAAHFRERLAQLGWVEDRNLRIDYRLSFGDPGRLAGDAEELVNLRPDVILAFSGPAGQAVQASATRQNRCTAFLRRVRGPFTVRPSSVNGGQDRYRMRRRVSRLPGLTDRV